jgi:hypothetical protein
MSNESYDSANAESPYQDFFPTPQWAIEALFNPVETGMGEKPSPIHSLHSGYVLEPAAGRGAICEVVYQHWPTADIVGVEVDPRLAGCSVAKAAPWGVLVCADALEWVQKNNRIFDLIITNPPYFKRGVERYFHAMWPKVAPGGQLALMANIDWLGCNRRRQIFSHYPFDLIIIRDRIDFVPQGDREKKPSNPRFSIWCVWTKLREGEHRDPIIGWVGKKSCKDQTHIS